MRMLTFGENLTVFLLFFGIATLDAMKSRAWPRVAFWLVIALVFAAAGWYSAKRERRKDRHPSAAP